MAASGRCRLLHAWGRWGALEKGKRTYAKEVVGDFIYQRRTCDRCGAIEFREVAS